MTAVRLSVVLPCYNAARELPAVLDALAAQDERAFEVIVVDDGSTDGTLDAARAWRGPVPLRAVAQPNRGRSAARNRGAAEARAPVILFLDADVRAAPSLVARHLAHYANPDALLAVQGTTTPDPSTLDSAFMRLAAGPARDLTRRRPGDLSPLHAVGRNFSVTRAAHARIGGFDDAFTGYGFEDVDYALRLRAAGGRIRFDPAATGIHHHPMTLEAAVARQRENGRSAVYLWRKHGRPGWLGLHLELHPALLPLKWLCYRTGWLPALARRARPRAEHAGLLPVLNEVYNTLLWDAYYDGVFQALRAPHAPSRALRVHRTEP